MKTPRLAGLLLKVLLERDLSDRIRADLEEEMAEFVVKERGALRARLWYWNMTWRSIAAGWRASRAVWSGRGPSEDEGGSRMKGRRTVALEGLIQDLHIAVRSLVRNPGLAASAAGVMALGIAAAAVVFSVLDEVLIRPLPYAAPDRILSIHSGNLADPTDLGNVSYPNMSDLAERARTLDGVVAGAFWAPAFTDAGNAQVVRGLTVSWNYFALLGIQPAAGRFFVPEDEGEGRAPVAVISYDVWRDRYGNDPGVVGSMAELGFGSYQIVGVTPRGFEDPIGQSDGQALHIWRTPWFNAVGWYRSGRSWKGLARLADGATIAAAREEMGRIMAQLATEWPEENEGETLRAQPIHQMITGPVRQTLLILAASVGLILLIACANVANLLLARGIQRRDELEVRVALGASGARILRTTLAESVVLALVGGTLGVALAYGGLGAVTELAASSIPRLSAVSLDARALAFAAVVSVVTGLVFGALPALWNRRLAGGGRRATAGRGDSRVRRALVVVEVALTVVLLFGAGLFLRTFDALYDVDVGVDLDGVVSFSLHDAGWSDMEPAEGEAQWDGLRRAISEVPGVSAVGAIDIVPLVDSYSCDGTSRADLPPPEPGAGSCTEVRVLTAGALEALGVGLVSGRLPEEGDRGDGPRATWVSESTHRLLWPDGRSPLGTGLRVHGEEFTVMGVVTDIRHFGPDAPPRPMLYLTAHQEPWNGIARGLSIVVSGSDLRSREPALRAAVESVNPAIPIGPVTSMTELLATNLSAPRLRLTLIGVFATLALVLSMVGLAGVLGFSVSRRRREIGVRLALGAEARSIRSMVMREGLLLLLRGLVFGLLAALPAATLMGHFLFGVEPWDPISVLGVSALMAAGMAAASWPSAWRAARSTPLSALRTD